MAEDFFSLPAEVLKGLQEEEMYMIVGGNSITLDFENNSSGTCTGTNNDSGVCAGANNNSGRCNGNNNYDGICSGTNNNSGRCGQPSVVIPGMDKNP